MIGKISNNWYVGRYGEDLSFKLKDKKTKKYLFTSLVLNKYSNAIVTKKDKEFIIDYYCNLGASLDSIHHDNLFEMKMRVVSLSFLMSTMIYNYRTTNDKKYYDNIFNIFRDIECLKLSDEQYDEWFIKKNSSDDEFVRYKAEYDLQKANNK